MTRKFIAGLAAVLLARPLRAAAPQPVSDEAFFRDLTAIRAQVPPNPQYEFRLHYNPNTGIWTCLSDADSEGYNLISIRQILTTGYGECAWLGGKRLLFGEFNGMELRGAGMYDADMGGVDMRSADLLAVDARWAGAQQAYFNNARMDYSLWTDADLFQADLSGASLRFANLARVQLNGAWLKGTDLTGSDLGDADLREADLTGAVLKDTVLRGASFDEGTRLPFPRSEALRRGMKRADPDPNPGLARRRGR